MNGTVPRTCAQLNRGGELPASDALPKTLADYREEHAYILLGDPGSGKTTAFQTESEALGDEALFITARDFLVHATALHELHGKTLFIDGLDEVRAGESDARTPFDEIRRLLIELARPRFRISCREADWLGENDRHGLSYVVPDSSVAVLRLEPLTKAGSLSILRDSLGVGHPRDFLMQARQAGLEGLLDNPQSLELLARAVNQGDGWPESRLEVFELACREMAGESNQEHRLAAPINLSSDSRIDCAGLVCALLLISDKTGYSLDTQSQGADRISRIPCGNENPQNLRAAVSSKLFRADSERCFSPIHRQIAEFLGAKHLSRLVEDGLSPRRVLALMAGGDGVVVTALRGLSAWLATHSEPIRAGLISKSPVDLVIYGDLGTFSGDDRRRVLEALLAQPVSLSRALSSSTRFSPLVTSETESQIRGVLSSEGRDWKQEIRVRFLSQILCEAERLPSLDVVILEIVRDRSWTDQVREAALETFVHYQQASPKGDKKLTALLEEFRAEGISIANCDLCSTLLRTLYPRTVGPARVWDYFSPCSDATMCVKYLEFWRSDLLAQSTTKDVAELLDALATSTSRLEPTFNAFGLWNLLLEMLRRGLGLDGGRVDADRVSAWLRACAGAAERRGSNPPQPLLEIRAWLERHPEVQKQVILEGMEVCQGGDDVGHADFKNRRRLVGAKLPADFGRWCLTQAVRLASSKPGVAKHLFLESYRALQTPDQGEGLSLEVLQGQARGHALLMEVLTQLQAPTPAPKQQEHLRQQHATWVAEQERQHEQLWEVVRSHESLLLENRAHPELLHQLALVYFDEAQGAKTGLHGEGAIAHALRDPAAVAAAMHGLRYSVYRDDLPSVREIIRLAKNDKQHLIGWPVLAGLLELQESSPGFVLQLEDTRLHTCVACLHCWKPPFTEIEQEYPLWYQALLEHRPELVSDVATQCAVSALRNNRAISVYFWFIAKDPREQPGSRNALLGFLRALPTRCNSLQIDNLDELVWSGLQRGWQSQLVDLAGTRLSKGGMDAGQRVRWLGLGMICEPSAYGQGLARTVSGKERLVRHLGRFFVYGDDYWFERPHVWYYALKGFEPADLALIIRLLGRFFARVEPAPFVYRTEEGQVSRLLERFINDLASRPCNSASESLDSLSDDPELPSWHGLLSVARTAQRRLRRDAEYRHPTIQQACETLTGGRPANACDLAALTVDKIDAIAHRIRTSNSNEWRQYWNEGPHGVPDRPKVEEACRDALLAALRPLLPESVGAEPEVRHVSQTRADLAIIAGDFRIPIEAKKNDHADLWSALDNQLVAKYTLDPATGGYGVYLVFWFGAEHQRKRADGERPTGPQELEGLLRNSLAEDQARKIHTRVIDVCRPGPPR